MKQGKSRSESGFRCHWIQGCVIKKVTLWPVAQLDPPTSPVRSYSQEAAPNDWRTQLLAAPSSVSRRRHFFSSRVSKSLDRVICPSLSQPCSQRCGHSWMARCGVRAMDIKMATSGWNFVGSEVGFLREKPRHDGWKKGFWTSKYQKCPPWFQLTAGTMDDKLPTEPSALLYLKIRWKARWWLISNVWMIHQSHETAEV